MSGTLTVVGSRSIGQTLPCLVQMVGGVRESIGVQLPSVQGQVTGLLKATVTPPSLSVGPTAALKTAASLRAKPPTFNVSLGLIVGLVAKLTASLGKVNANLGLATSLTATLGTAGVHSYAHSGTVSALGTNLSNALSGGFPGGGGASAASNGIILGTQVASTWAALQKIFGIGGNTQGLQYLGNKTLGLIIPTALTAAAGLTASVGLVLPSIQAQIAGFAQLAPKLAIQLPSLSANIAAAAKIGLQVSVGLPQVGLQVAGLAKLQAQLGSLNAQLAAALAINALLGLGGVAVYTYGGDVGSFGSSVSSGLSGGLVTGGTALGNCNAIVLGTESPVSWAAIQQVLGTV